MKPIVRELSKTGDRDRYILLWRGVIKRFSINRAHIDSDKVPAELNYHIKMAMGTIRGLYE